MTEEHCLTSQVISFFQKNGIRLKCAYEPSSIESIQSLVMVGLGVSMVPQMARSGRIPVAYRSLENPKPTRSVTAIWKSGRKQSRGASEFLNDLRQTAKAYSQTLNK
jgi:LysR family transcriptional regulator, hydrogen peroxide-inducible genes activator